MTRNLICWTAKTQRCCQFSYQVTALQASFVVTPPNLVVWIKITTQHSFQPKRNYS